MNMLAQMSHLFSPAFAQGAPAPSKPSLLEQFLPFILLIIVFYFFVLRPQGKKAKAHQDFLANIKRGDNVITSSGMLGRIEGITEKFVTLEVSDGVRVRILKSFVASLAEEKSP